MIVCLLLTLCAILASAEPEEAADPTFQAHVAALRARHPITGFHIQRCDAFVVLSDVDDAAVRARHAATITWFTGAMRRMYFENDPGLTDIWLFRDKRSYEDHSAAFFDIPSESPYGYFSHRHGLVMNIATGGGTLCHELVHAYVRANFAACPDWLNEGLASLYEQCGQRGDDAIGLVNWRLVGLQEAIAAGRLRSFESLSTTDFYGPDSALNYAQARYLCLHLQETGRLTNLVLEAMRDQASDPTAWRTLVRILGEADLAAFQRRWEAWVTGLKLPERR